MFESQNCSFIPASVPSDAGIAGAGVLLSSAITAFIAVLLSATLIFSSFSPKCTPSPATLRRKLLNGYSDQQIIVGIGIQSVGLFKASSLVAYHFFIIWMMSLLSMATHNATLLTLVHDFRRDWVLRWLRQVLMFVNLALSCVFGVLILQSKIRGLPATLPIGCVFQWEADGENDGVGVKAVDYAGTVATIVGNAVVFAGATWYLHDRRQRWYRATQVVGLVVMAGIAIGATTRAYLLSQAFGTPDVVLADEGEKTWSFGQLLGLLMLLLPVVSVIEIVRGEVSVAPLVEDESDGERLIDGQPLSEYPVMVKK
ncbi:hypothetical protein QBC34DRAFT_315430 [Podospora aff. communis PSN243]|uniref:Uncharacterized protein n=1 Tax=Podospora aff. communis PSN243 TaxID=3040156 RepID=A0AAV9H5Z1_9PEZI|nr:hypothetical protein QBC34DRAFT_315430 [Podospora aff. communis PSN243]